MDKESGLPPLWSSVKLADIAPRCEIFVNRQIYEIKDLVKGRLVADIGCGDGNLKEVIEKAGGKWVGVEAFGRGKFIVMGRAENLPFKNCLFDIVIMNAVLEHVPDVSKAFFETSRVLKKGGMFIGYVAFTECFHDISYAHLSFKGLEYFAQINNMKLEKISGGRRFGIDYHLRALFFPFNINFLRGFIAFCIRSIIWLKSKLAFVLLWFMRRKKIAEAINTADLYFKIECLRQSVGFDFLIRKL